MLRHLLQGLASEMLGRSSQEVLLEMPVSLETVWGMHPRQTPLEDWGFGTGCLTLPRLSATTARGMEPRSDRSVSPGTPRPGCGVA